MAYEKLTDKKTIATNLGEYTNSLMSLLQKQRILQRLKEEQKFNQAVLEDNLTIDQQIDFRNNQLKTTEKGDKEEIIRLKGEISTLKDLKEQETFNNAYLEQLNDLNSGTQSIESTLKWLKGTLEKTTDQAIKKSIKQDINSFESQLYEQRKSALNAKTTYASNSQDIEIISNQIKRVNSERVKAMNAGNDDYVALLDLQLQALSKANTEAAVNKTLLDISVATMTGNNAKELLNQFNREIENADPSVPITIGQTRYESAKQFWEMKRSEYLNDNSENGFFNRYQNELSEKVTYKSTKNILSNDNLGEVTEWYDSLKDRPELAEYMEKIDQYRQKSLKATADLRGSQILNRFKLNLNAEKALKDLAYIQDEYGVDQTLNYQNIVSEAAAEKQNQVSQILSTMSSIMAANPSTTSQQAMEMAIKSGAGATVTPEELATGKASDIISGLSEKAESQQFGEESPITVREEMSQKFGEAKLNEGELYKLPNESTVYKYEGGNLRPFTGSWNEEQFKQYTGKGFDSIKQVSNIAGISKGQPIVKEQAELQTNIEEVGERISSPDLLKYYKPEQIITKGTDKFLKAGVKPVTGQKLGGEQWTQLQQQYDPKTLEDKIIRAGKDIYLKQE